MTPVKSTIHDQRGIASILSVVFFILIASVVTVGFMRLALLEGRQSLEDSLSKAALAAAYSGVNDAKRALLYCSQFAVRPAECNDLNTQTCPGFFGNATLQSKLGLLPVTGTGSIQVGDTTLNERYTCVIVTEDTYTVDGTLIPGSSEEATTLIPLRGTGSFNKVVISWHSDTLTSTIAGLDYDLDSLSASYRDADSFSAYFRANPNWPALIGAHLMVQQQNQSISYNADGSVAGLDQRRWLLFPYGATGENDVSISDATRQLVRCTEAGRALKSGGGSYHCQIEITGLDALPGTQYLQLTGLYNKSDYVVELMQNNTPVRFDNVSPQIDSTGAVENVFRRVKVGLRYEGAGFGGRNPILPNAVDTGAGLCKNFAVGGTSAEFNETCGF
jgi:hypothetical protein